MREIKVENITEKETYTFNVLEFISVVMINPTKAVWKCLETDVEILDDFFDDIEDKIYDYDSTVDNLSLPSDEDISDMADGKIFTWYNDDFFTIADLVDKLKNDLEIYTQYM